MHRFHVESEDMKITTFSQKLDAVNLGPFSLHKVQKIFLLICQFTLLFYLAAWACHQPASADGENTDKYKGRIEENSTVKAEDLFFGTGVPSNYEILRRAASNQDSDGLTLTTRKSLPANAFEHLWQTYTQEAAKAYKEKRLSDAESMYRAAAKQAERFVPSDKRVASTLTNLGAVLRDEGKWEEAETVFKRALALKSEHLSPSDPSLASTLNHYACLLRKMGRADEAQMMESRAESITTAAAAYRQNQIAMQNEAAKSAPQNTTEDPLLNAFANMEQKGGREPSATVRAVNDHHVITNILNVSEHQGQKEPFWFTRQIVVAYGDPSGNWTAHVGPRETYAGYLDSGAASNETSAELYNLATKYGINDDRLDIIARNGGTLLEIDNSVLFYARYPISSQRWPVGLAVEIGRPEFLEEPMYMIKSEGESGQIIVREMAAR